MSKIIRVDMSNLKVGLEDPLPEYALLGGRGLTARILSREVPPTSHPLSKHNKIIFAPGLMAGSRFPSSARLSAGFKSPLTQGIKESNVGGTAGGKLGRLGIKAIILEGEPADNKRYVIKVNKDGAAILPADNLAGLTNYATVKELMAAYGKDIAVLTIGPAGERKVSMASVASTDVEGYPSRQMARGGPGAVMGSKGVKAIVIDDTGTKPLAAKRAELFRDLVQEYTEFLKTSKGASLVGSYGTMGGLTWISDLNHSLPVRNFTAGMFEGAGKIGGKKTIELLTSQGSRWGVACMPGCLVRCSNIVKKGDRHITSGLEYETVAMLGSNLGIDDVHALAEMDRLDDDYGVDNIEMGATLGVAVAAGLMNFGDTAKAIALINEIGQGTTLGKILGEGAAFTARAFGISRVPAVKGLGLPAHDPRVENVTAITYCTSPMGSDHTAGDVVVREPLSADAVKVSRQVQINVAILDSLGFCLGTTKSVRYPMEKIAEIVNAQFGLDLSPEDIQDMGKAVLKEERAFNLNAGIAPSADRLPDFIKEEPLPPSNFVFDISDSEIDSFWDF